MQTCPVKSCAFLGFDTRCSTQPDPSLKPHFRLQGWAQGTALSQLAEPVGSSLQFDPLESLRESVAKKHTPGE